MQLLLSFYLLAASAYVMLAIRGLLRLNHPAPRAGGDCPPMTVLKPLHGDEPGLFENLLSFCQQDYPQYQVIFGVSSADDAAVAVARRVIAACPEADLALVVNDRLIGSNRKICNVANCHELSRYDLLVIADSDMRVAPDYLRRIAGSFEDPGVAAGTCLYRGRPVAGLASWLGAAYINEWFLPSVLVATSFQSLHFCFGATMAVRRSALEAIGGFERLANELADDYRLGDLVASQCGRVALIPCIVENTVHEPSLASLLRHELRWARTVRSVQAGGYAMSFLTYITPAALAFALMVGAQHPFAGMAAVGWAVGLRALLHDVARTTVAPGQPAAYGLTVLRDLLCFGVWVASFLGRNVEWQGYEFKVDKQGHMELKGTVEPS